MIVRSEKFHHKLPPVVRHISDVLWNFVREQDDSWPPSERAQLHPNDLVVEGQTPRLAILTEERVVLVHVQVACQKRTNESLVAL